MNEIPVKDQMESLASILQNQVIPCWERFGTERLAITTKTLPQFKTGPHPELMQTSIRNRVSKMVKAHGRRVYNNASSFVETWPEDNQAIFRYPALAFVINGVADFHVADYVIHCPRWHFILFANGVPRPRGGPHFVGNVQDRRCKILWFFRPPGINSIIAYICHSAEEKHWSEAYHVVHRPEVTSLFQLMLSEFENASDKQEKLLALSVQTFLYLFLNELHEGCFHKVGDISKLGIPEDMLSPIGQAQQYIKANLRKSLTTATVAQQVHMSRGSFIRTFSRETGQSFHEFVNKYRMEEAGRLLRQGHWSIQPVCSAVGLKPTQFLTQFKKYYGITPSQFRQNSKNKHNTDEG